MDTKKQTKTAKPTTIEAWSFSRLKVFESCNLRAKLAFLTKVKLPPEDPDSPALRGTKIHTEAEKFVLGTGKLTANLKKFKTELTELAALYKADPESIEVEGDWGFDNKWNVCGWWDKNVWARIKLDVFRHEDQTSAILIDYKTGKKFGNEVRHTEQGQVYAIAAFRRYPKLEFVQSQFWYLDHGLMLKSHYTREVIDHLQYRMDKRAHTMTSATVFPANPNKFNCKWCPYKDSGDCATAFRD